MVRGGEGGGVVTRTCRLVLCLRLDGALSGFDAYPLERRLGGGRLRHALG